MPAATSFAATMGAAAACLVVAAAASTTAALPADLASENARLVDEVASLRLQLQKAQEQNAETSRQAPTSPLAIQNLQGSKPNIFILFGDDIGSGDLGCYGHPTSQTPFLDRMAAEGAKLTSYESAANVCSPSRASIMTGRYYTRAGAWPGVFSPNSVSGLPLREITIPKQLATVGCASASTAVCPAATDQRLAFRACTDKSGMVGKW
jgi:hypothetical protein